MMPLAQRHGVDDDPFAQLEMIAEDIEIIALAQTAIDQGDSKIGRMLERTAARMNDALTALQRRI